MSQKKNRAVGALLGLAAATLPMAIVTLSRSFATSETQSPFLDGTATAGIEFKHQRGASDKKHLIETMGSGCAFLDYDNDGLLDIFLINGGATPDSPPVTLHGHALYRNLGNGKFKDVTAQSGIKGNGSYGVGVAVGDYDNDGYPDIYITNFGSNILYHNNGDGTFTDVTERAGVSDPGWSSASSGKSVGDCERQRTVSMRNRRNFLQVESNELC